jgi:hypothetical protein
VRTRTAAIYADSFTDVARAAAAAAATPRIKTTSEAGPNVVEAVLGFVPSGDPDQLRLRDDLADPLQVRLPIREPLAPLPKKDASVAFFSARACARRRGRFIRLGRADSLLRRRARLGH